MKEKIVEYEGKMYVLVSDNEERECVRCALFDKCNKQSGLICQEMGFTVEETHKHRLEELKDEPLTEQKKRLIAMLNDMFYSQGDEYKSRYRENYFELLWQLISPRTFISGEELAAKIN